MGTKLTLHLEVIQTILGVGDEYLGAVFPVSQILTAGGKEGVNGRKIEALSQRLYFQNMIPFLQMRPYTLDFGMSPSFSLPPFPSPDLFHISSFNTG